ncbi:Transthyretin-like family protein [Onchocerca flexuosa]|uniref:Transthyretin-like family protein n=1 Tax=Onchocerca flexuosa TaxID=387005 RepID=A0A238C428_9BILA|nr:Transthyretin-like family protein [Onchocerca flexuosa]
MKAVLFVFLTILGICIGMRLQAVRAKGQLKCGDRPAKNVKVKLWDEDDGPDPDDVLDENETDGNGNFDLEGSTRELTTIDPVLKIYHDCDDSVKPGKRKIKLRIPGQYISPGSKARKAFDIGPDPDDLLDQGYTDGQGNFMLKGDTSELTVIDPVFKVYHDCDDKLKPGQRKIKFKIPASYISEGKTAKKTFDLGVINLETIFSDEERELITS